MMIEEFTKLTGFYPTMDMYRGIEEAYTAFKGTKQEFCAAYKANKDGMAEKIALDLCFASVKASNETAKEIKELKKQISTLTAALEREQEWQLYEDPHNVAQDEYEELSRSGKKMTDEEAIDWVVQETGFERSRIKIIRSIDAEEINRHNQTRRTEKKLDRSPIYCATDWNYVRFDVRANVTRSYELFNDEIRPFYD